MQNYEQDYHEQLGGGAAHASHAEDGSGTTVKVVPITEGERTVGHRKNGDESPAIWDEEPLRAAVEQGTLDGTLIVKGEGGKNPHFPMDEQVPPENILGRIDRWDYEDETGPVGYAQLADEDIANRVGMGLLEVSADWLRRLGEYDSNRGGKPVTEIVDLPRVHVLERGAAQGASIEITPETAEALGYNPDVDDDEHGTASIEEEETVSDTSGADEDLEAQHATSGDAVKWESSSGGEREPASERYGVVVDNLQEDDDDKLMVAVYQPTSDYDGWESRNESIRMSDDSLERVGGDGKASLPSVSNVVEQDAGLIDRLAARVATVLNGDGDGDGDVETESEAEAEAEQQAETTVTQPSYSGTQEGDSWEAPTFSDFDEDFSAARASATIDRTPEGEENFSDLGLFVVSPNGSDEGSLDLAGLRAANSRASQANGVSEDEVSRLQTMYSNLAEDEFGVEWDSEQDAAASANEADEKSAEGHAAGASNGDEPAEADTGTGANDANADADSTENMTDNNELQSQLAEIKSEKNELASEKEELQSQLSEKEETNEDLQSQLSAKEETIEEKNERIESLEKEAAPLKEMLAEIAAGDSMLNPERIAETHSTEELVDMLAEDEADEDSTSYTDKVKEQLAAAVEPRGDAGSEGGADAAGNLDEQQAAQVEQLAEKVMTAQDWKAAQDYSSNREYVKTTKGVDPANASSEVELRQKIQNSASADGGD